MPGAIAAGAAGVEHVVVPPRDLHRVRAHRAREADDLRRPLAFHREADQQAGDLRRRGAPFHDLAPSRRPLRPRSGPRGASASRSVLETSAPGPATPSSLARESSAGCACPSPVRIDSGWNCTPWTGQLAVAQAHDRAVLLRPRRHLELGRQPGLGDDQRVVPRRDERPGEPAEHAAAVVLDRRRLAVHRDAGAHDRAAEDRADRLVPEADAENRRRLPAAAGSRSIVMPASSGRPGPGEMTIRSGFAPTTSSTVTASLRTTRTSAPSSPRYCTRL